MKEHNSQTYHKTCGYDKIKSMMKLLACTVSAALCLSMSAAAYAEADVDGIQTTIGEAISTEAAESPYDSALTDDIYASATGTLNISGTQNYTYASQVITLLNEQRVNNGLSPLTADSTLTAAAMQRAAETVIYFSHTRPNGSRCFTAFDGGWRGENIAAGQADPDEVITGWMNSTGHRENILKANYTSVGVGCFNYKGINFWVQCFSDITADGSVRTGTASATAAVSASTDYINMSGKLAENTFSSAGETTIFTVSNNNVGWTYITATVDSSSFNYSSSSSAAKVDSAGNVTVAGGGTAIITAATKKGSLSVSDTLTSTAPRLTPSITSITAGSGKVDLSWSSVSGATNYAVYYTANGKWYNAGTTTALKMTVSGLTGGTRYGFAVKAYVNGKWSGITSADIVYATPVGAAVAKPKITKAEGQNGQVALNWTAVSGATNYAVYTYLNGTWSVAGYRTATGMYVRNLTNGTKYGFAVKAYVNGTWSSVSSSDIVYATPVSAAAKPVITKAQGQNGRVALNWTAVNGATNYAVYTYLNGKWSVAGYRTATGMYVTGLTNGTKYGFAVKAYVNGAWTNITSADIVYATPTAAKSDLMDTDFDDFSFLEENGIDFVDVAPTVR
ncbi:MAG: CAP domain-containing protein [Oscillospiraceae bacterium]|nr:CAP domain-containing protein [Oscillospiraceae bacterium]